MIDAWIYVVAAAAVAFVGFVAFGRGWLHSLAYSWRNARHQVELTEAEAYLRDFRADIGSMTLADDPHGEAIVERVRRYGDISGPPGGKSWSQLTGDWREQTAADLSPEALGGFEVTEHAPEPPGGWDSLMLAAPIDPGPGDDTSLASPGPDQDPGGGCGDFVVMDLPPARDWLEAQMSVTFDWVRLMVPQVTGWRAGI